jgi:hypothetical protein
MMAAALMVAVTAAAVAMVMMEVEVAMVMMEVEVEVAAVIAEVAAVMAVPQSNANFLCALRHACDGTLSVEQLDLADAPVAMVADDERRRGPTCAAGILFDKFRHAGRPCSRRVRVADRREYRRNVEPRVDRPRANRAAADARKQGRCSRAVDTSLSARIADQEVRARDVHVVARETVAIVFAGTASSVAAATATATATAAVTTAAAATAVIAAAAAAATAAITTTTAATAGIAVAAATAVVVAAATATSVAKLTIKIARNVVASVVVTSDAAPVGARELDHVNVHRVREVSATPKRVHGETHRVVGGEPRVRKRVGEVGHDTPLARERENNREC